MFKTTVSNAIRTTNQVHCDHLEDTYPDFIKNFEGLFEKMNFIIENLNFSNKDTWSKSKCYQYLIFPEAMKTLHCAYEITAKGYYEDACKLLRSVLNDFFELVFLSLYPDNLEGLLKKLKNVPNFNATNISEKLLEKKNHATSPYSLLSTFEHGKKYTMLNEYIDRTTHKNLTPVSPLNRPVDKVMIEFCLGMLLALQYLLLKSMSSLFSKEIEMTKQFTDKLPELKSAEQNLEKIITNDDIKKMSSNACSIFSRT